MLTLGRASGPGLEGRALARPKGPAGASQRRGLRKQAGGSGDQLVGLGPEPGEHARLGDADGPIGVTFGEGQTIMDVIRADNDVPSQVWEEEPGQARVLFQGHDGVFRLRPEHPESTRLRAELDQALPRKARVWFIAQKPDLALVDVLPADRLDGV